MIFLTYLAAFYATTLNTMLGVQSIDPNLVRAARCLGARPWTVVRTVVLPGALPYLFTGLQIAMGVAWFSLVAGEMIAGRLGLGYLINSSYTTTSYPDDRGRDDHARPGRLRLERPHPPGRKPADGLPGAGDGVMTGGHLTLTDVGKVYDSARGQVVAVADCSLEVRPGELHVLVGPSGCGKSTLLGAVAGFTDISSGSIEIDGDLICGPGRPQAEPGADRVGGVPGQHAVPLAHRRRERRLRARGPGSARSQGRPRGSTGAAGGGRPRRRGRPLSRRALQRAAAPGRDPAGAVQRAAVLLLDEPFRGMDALSRSSMHEALLEMYDRSGVTVLFITHDVEEAVFLGTHVSVMTTRPGTHQVHRRDRPRPSPQPRHRHRPPVPRARRCGVGRGARRGQAGLRGRRAGDDPMSTLALATDLRSAGARRGAVGILVAVLLWEVATRLDEWIGLAVPFVATLPAPTEVLADLGGLISSPGYWNSWSLSLQRVALGFTLALLLGGGLGLLMATSPLVSRPSSRARDAAPDPAAGLGPLAIIFWPTQELSITFVTFLGAFFPIVVNTVSGADQIDPRYLVGGPSMGANRRVHLPRG